MPSLRLPAFFVSINANRISGRIRYTSWSFCQVPPNAAARNGLGLFIRFYITSHPRLATYLHSEVAAMVIP